MTFIKALKNDLRAKLPNSVRVTTFHDFCYGQLRESGSDAELYWNLSGIPHCVRRRIRRLRGLGLSYAAIADRLNHDRVPTAQGGAAWYDSTVRVALGKR
jgi:hypothetical protein